MKFYRDGYNRTNLDVGLSRFMRIRFWAVHEPWDGPSVGLIIEIGSRQRKFLRVEFAWGDA